MTNTEKQDDPARQAGEYEECPWQVASMEAVLARIGAAFCLD